MIKKFAAIAAIILITGCAQLTTEERLLRGSADDVYSLGLMYLHGQGVNVNKELAMNHLTSAAERGSVGARYKLGIIYDKSKKMDEAVFWYKKAAKTPYMAHPMYRLAEIYHHGIGVDKDLDLAISYYLKTAKLGYESSMRALSSLYLEKKKYKEAYVWAKVVEISGAKDVRQQVELISFEIKPLEVLKLDDKAESYADLYLHRF